jgi:hypothetical protein
MIKRTRRASKPAADDSANNSLPVWMRPTQHRSVAAAAEPKRTVKRTKKKGGRR